MLGQRILTAVVLLAILAAALASDQPMWFLTVLALATAGAAWEWLRMTLPQGLPRATGPGTAIVLFVVMLGAAGLWVQGGDAALPLQRLVAAILAPAAALVWLLGASAAVVRGQSDAAPGNVGWSLFAPLALFTGWAVLALMYLAYGGVFVVSLLALVWVADIAAYFVGRALGRHKLAPRVSPGKTIEGAVAGVAGAVIWILVSAIWPNTFGHLLVERWTVWGAIPLAALLGGIAIMGDLFESLLKRRAGRKDSSALLPGHGGVYDRIDAIIPVMPVALLLSGIMS
ncbi:phosphatidate cytidylyltransferase [Bordetella genomosp. 13]|uniref:Phosphatidate cytidylyltransferase n=1 Tax=Bordetella genomosp. 13 TaxID=463040 RepID=A0A1W6ZAT6_9BORD|nr:phosphatidate cytidylyltransferase [Bordetella genomosp. 13]ARP94270.1 phosphatidate cytidylyltransferase [Bordetella genomosp. 13]